MADVRIFSVRTAGPDFVFDAASKTRHLHRDSSSGSIWLDAQFCHAYTSCHPRFMAAETNPQPLGFNYVRSIGTRFHGTGTFSYFRCFDRISTAIKQKFFCLDSHPETIDESSPKKSVFSRRYADAVSAKTRPLAGGHHLKRRLLPGSLGRSCN